MLWRHESLHSSLPAPQAPPAQLQPLTFPHSCPLAAAPAQPCPLLGGGWALEPGGLGSAPTVRQPEPVSPPVRSDHVQGSVAARSRLRRAAVPSARASVGAAKRRRGRTRGAWESGAVKLRGGPSATPLPLEQLVRDGKSAVPQTRNRTAAGPTQAFTGSAGRPARARAGPREALPHRPRVAGMYSSGPPPLPSPRSVCAQWVSLAAAS